MSYSGRLCKQTLQPNMHKMWMSPDAVFILLQTFGREETCALSRCFLIACLMLIVQTVRLAINCRALNALIGALQTNNHGWRVTSDRNHIKWMSREQAPPEFPKCLSSKCKKTHYSTNQCSCRFNDISCTELCSRTGCQNVAETLAEYKLDNNCSDDDDEDINI